MRVRRILSFWTVIAVLGCLGLTTGCWKSDETPDPGGVAPPSAEEVQIERDDMTSLPGADVDLKLLEDFPSHLKQETTLSAGEVFAYYDDFFSDRGWSVDALVDPLMDVPVRRYQLDNELGFLTVTAIDDGRNEVLLTRRTLRDGERIPSGL